MKIYAHFCLKQTIFTLFLIAAFCIFSFAQTEKPVCPTIKVVGPDSVLRVDETAFFSAELGGEAKNYKIEYEWKVENGEIAGGQGTSQIKVLPKEHGANLKATVAIKGLPENCSNIKSEVAGIATNICDRIEFDNYGKIPLMDEIARLDNFMASLSQDESYKGYIHITTDKDESIEEVKEHIQLLLKHIRFREFPKEKIIFAIEKSERHSTTLRIITEDMEITVCENCEIIKGKDL